MDFKDAKVGDEVVYIERGWRGNKIAEETRIAKVGRLYVYIERFGRLQAFNKSDGREKSTGYSCGTRLTTQEERVREALRDELWSQLRDKGFELRTGFRRAEYSDEIVERLVAVLEDVVVT